MRARGLFFGRGPALHFMNATMGARSRILWRVCARSQSLRASAVPALHVKDNNERERERAAVAPLTFEGLFCSARVIKDVFMGVYCPVYCCIYTGRLVGE